MNTERSEGDLVIFLTKLVPNSRFAVGEGDYDGPTGPPLYASEGNTDPPHLADEFMGSGAIGHLRFKGKIPVLSVHPKSHLGRLLKEGYDPYDPYE